MIHELSPSLAAATCELRLQAVSFVPPVYAWAASSEDEKASMIIFKRRDLIDELSFEDLDEECGPSRRARHLHLFLRRHLASYCQ